MHLHAARQRHGGQRNMGGLDKDRRLRHARLRGLPRTDRRHIARVGETESQRIQRSWQLLPAAGGLYKRAGGLHGRISGHIQGNIRRRAGAADMLQTNRKDHVHALRFRHLGAGDVGSLDKKRRRGGDSEHRACTRQKPDRRRRPGNGRFAGPERLR